MAINVEEPQGSGDEKAAPCCWMVRRDSAGAPSNPATFRPLTEIVADKTWDFGRVSIPLPFPFHFFPSKCSHKENVFDR